MPQKRDTEALLNEAQAEIARLNRTVAEMGDEIAALQAMYDLAIQIIVDASESDDDEDFDPLDFLDGSDWGEFDDDDEPDSD